MSGGDGSSGGGDASLPATPPVTPASPGGAPAGGTSPYARKGLTRYEEGAVLLRVKDLFREGQFDACEALLLGVESRGGWNEGEHREEAAWLGGLLAKKTGRYREATELFRKCLTVSIERFDGGDGQTTPSRVAMEALKGRGTSALYLFNYRDASRDFKEWLRLRSLFWPNMDPTSSFYNLGLCYKHLYILPAAEHFFSLSVSSARLDESRRRAEVALRLVRAMRATTEASLVEALRDLDCGAPTPDGSGPASGADDDSSAAPSPTKQYVSELMAFRAMLHYFLAQKAWAAQLQLQPQQPHQQSPTGSSASTPSPSPPASPVAAVVAPPKKSRWSFSALLMGGAGAGSRAASPRRQASLPPTQQQPAVAAAASASVALHPRPPDGRAAVLRSATDFLVRTLKHPEKYIKKYLRDPSAFPLPDSLALDPSCRQCLNLAAEFVRNHASMHAWLSAQLSPDAEERCKCLDEHPAALPFLRAAAVEGDGIDATTASGADADADAATATATAATAASGGGEDTAAESASAPPAELPAHLTEETEAVTEIPDRYGSTEHMLLRYEAFNPRDLGFVPKVIGLDREEPLLNERLRSRLCRVLPVRHCMHNWQLAFSTRVHGFSLSAFLRNCEDIGPNIVIVQTMDFELFGGFSAEPWCVSKYPYGNGETMVFSTDAVRSGGAQGGGAGGSDEQTFEAWGWSGRNRMFVECHEDRISFGGGQSVAFSIEGSTLTDGRTGPCASFDSPPLCSASSYRVKEVECWSLIPDDF